MNNSTNWQGVLIEESLDTTTLPSGLKIISTKTTTLEKETDRGILHFHNIEVSPENLEKVVKFISSHMRFDRWYLHLVKGEEMIVIYHHKVFQTTKDKKEQINEIQQYGLSLGILKEQLDFPYLFDHPFG